MSGHNSYSDEKIAAILRSVKHIALVGASPKPERPSFRVMQFLLSKGYDVVPVNPGMEGKKIHGRQVFARLAEVEGPIDMVDVFRASEYLPGVVDEVLQLDPRPKVIWTQLGVRDDAAAAKAEAEGLDVIMDRCPAIEYPRLIG